MKLKTGSIRSDSKWSGLTEKQRETLDGWLFLENLNYREVRKRAKSEWGVECSLSSLVRYYRRRAAHKAAEELALTAESTNEIEQTAVSPGRLLNAAMKLIGKRFLEGAVEGDEVTDLARLGRILLQSEERDIQRSRVALARERFEFNAAKAALAELPNLKQMNAEDAAREEERVRAIKRRLFGNRVPRELPAPEISEEKKA